MRASLISLWLLLASIAPAAAARRPLDLPVRVSGSRVAAPAYAGDVVEIQLASSASRVAWKAEPAPRARLGVPALDRVATELGGARFTPLFRGERPRDGEESGPDLAAFYVVHLPPGVALEDALDRLSSLPDVIHADPVAILPVSAVPNDSLWSSSSWFYQPSRRDIHAPEAWDVTTGDTSTVVGILDTGVVPYHPDLGGTVAGLPGQIYTNWAEAGGVAGVDDDGNGYVDDVHGWDFVTLSPSEVRPGEDWRDEDNDPNGFCAHGTAVAGLVGALTDNGIGVAGTNWKVRLMPLRVAFSYPGAGLLAGEVRMDFVASAIQYAARMHVDVINCSFESVFDAAVVAALDAALAAGVTVVNSAGNNNGLNYIATRREVISVASVSSGDVVSGFSNKGPWLDLAAPGENIATTSMAFWAATTDSIELRQPAYVVTSGTSFSAPLVAGAAALIQARQRQLGKSRLDPFGVLLRLYDTADDIRALNPGLDWLYGSGRLNLARALTVTSGSRALRLSGKLVGPAAVFRLANGATRVVIACDDRSLVSYDGATLDTVWKVTLPFAPLAGPAVGALPGQGIGIFVAMTGGRVAGYLDDGTALSGWPALGAGSPMRAGVVVWDIDGDGPPEVLSGTDDGKVWAWHSNGGPVTGFPVTIAPNLGRVLPLAVSHEQPCVIAAAADDGSFALIAANGDLIAGPTSYPSTPSAPVIATMSGGPAVVFVEGLRLHALGFDGVERAPFPVTLAATMPARPEVAVADLDQNGSDDFVLPGNSPSTIDVRDTTGASLTGLGWPVTPGSPPLAPMVVGELNGGGGPPELMVLLSNGLAAISSQAQTQWGFPKPGEGGTFPSIADIDGDGSTDILAGSSTDKVLFCYDAGPGSASGSNPWPTFRGDFRRTGSARRRVGIPQVDLVAPGAVADLEATPVGPSTVRLRWTATGDDGATGPAWGYDLREAIAVEIDATNFSTATHVASNSPASPGTPDSVDVSGVPQGVVVWFALKVLDEGGNAGPISNAVSITLPAVSPNSVTDLRVVAASDSSVTLRWTATGSMHLVRAATSSLTEASFDQAPYSRTVPSTVAPGETETYVFKSLNRATRYWFALKAYNALYSSSLSNVVQAQTLPGGPIHGPGIALAPAANPSRVPATLYWQAPGGLPSGKQEIGIFDLRGRRIRTIDVGATAGGSVQWNGDDDDGRRVPAGLYLLRLRSGDRHVNARLVLLP